MEPYQVDVVAATMSGHGQQIPYTIESRLASQILGDVVGLDRLDGVHDDVSVVHGVAAAGLDVRPRPDADAATDPAAPNAVPKGLREHHDTLPGSRASRFASAAVTPDLVAQADDAVLVPLDLCQMQRDVVVERVEEPDPVPNQHRQH